MFTSERYFLVLFFSLSIFSTQAIDLEDIDHTISECITTLEKMSNVKSLYALNKENANKQGVEWYLDFIACSPQEKSYFLHDQAKVVYDAFQKLHEIQLLQLDIKDAELDDKIIKLGQAVRASYLRLDEYGKIRFIFYLQKKTAELQIINVDVAERQSLNLVLIVSGFKGYVENEQKSFFQKIDQICCRL